MSSPASTSKAMVAAVSALEAIMFWLSWTTVVRLSRARSICSGCTRNGPSSSHCSRSLEPMTTASARSWNPARIWLTMNHPSRPMNPTPPMKAPAAERALGTPQDRSRAAMGHSSAVISTASATDTASRLTRTST